MEALDFIKNEIEKFVQIFPMTRVRYEHDKMAKVHVIEVVPNEIYNSNDDYAQWESDLFDRFILQYPYENICFVSDDAIVGIENVDFVLCGSLFTEYSVKEEIVTPFDEITGQQQILESGLLVNSDNAQCINLELITFEGRSIQTTFEHQQPVYKLVA